MSTLCVKPLLQVVVVVVVSSSSVACLSGDCHAVSKFLNDTEKVL